MGIHRFYGGYISKLPYDDLISQERPPDGSVESLFIDMNGLFYKVKADIYDINQNVRGRQIQSKAIGGISPEQLEAQYMLSLGEKLKEILNMAKPVNNLVMCVDGIAPRAKVNQQRSRRYIGALERSREEKGIGGFALGPRLQKPFDSISITAGTAFMSRIDVYLQSWLVTNRASLPPLIIYSSHLVPGEGEHKIFRFIREGLIPQGNGYHLVYGLDSDLVMLSSLSPLNKIKLVRESFTDLVDIDTLKAGIIKDMAGKRADVDSKLVIQDYVLIIYLIGNDFLPSIFMLSVIEISIKIMIEIYTELNVYLTRADGSIIWENFANFLFRLTEEEEETLKRMAAIPFKHPATLLDATSVKRVDRDPSYNEQGTSRFGASRSIRTNYIVDSFDLPNFRALWYTRAFGPRTDEGKIISKETKTPVVDLDDIMSMCNDYIFGLQWILQYYIGGNVSSMYVYSHRYAPLMIDLSTTLTNNVRSGKIVTLKNVLSKPDDLPINILQLLVSVVPPASADLIPVPAVADLILNMGALVDLAPEEFDIDLDATDQDHYKIAILPPLDIKRVAEEVKKASGDRLPKEMEAQKDIVDQRGQRRELPKMELRLAPKPPSRTGAREPRGGGSFRGLPRGGGGGFRESSRGGGSFRGSSRGGSFRGSFRGGSVSRGPSQSGGSGFRGGRGGGQLTPGMLTL